MPPITIPGVPTTAANGSAQPPNDIQGSQSNPLAMLAAILPLLQRPAQPSVTQQTQMPGANIPMPQRQYPNMDTSSTSRDFQTKGGHERATMNSLFGNIAQAVQTAQKNSEAKKARSLAVDLERLTIAMQNPQNPQNAQVIKDIMDDPKRLKAVSEALNIPFMGTEDKRPGYAKQAMASVQQKLQQQGGDSGQPQANPAAVNNAPTPQGNAPIPNIGGAGSTGMVPGQPNPVSAIPGTGGGASFPTDAASRLMSHLPVAAGLSPETQLQGMLVKMGLVPSADSMNDYNSKLIDRAMNSGSTLTKQAMSDDTKMQIAQVMASVRDKANLAALQRALVEAYGKENVADINGMYRVKAVEKMTAAMDKRTATYKEYLDQKAKTLKDPKLEDQYKLFDSQLKDLQKQREALDKKYIQAQKDDEKHGVRLITKAEAPQVKAEYTAINDKIKDIQNKQAQLLGTPLPWSDVGGNNAGGVNNTGSGNGKSGTTSSSDASDFQPDELEKQTAGFLNDTENND